MTKTTRKQREALFRIFQRDFPTWLTPTTRRDGTQCPHCGEWSGDPSIIKVPSSQWRAFRKKVVGYCDGSGCVMLPWKSMWLGIEVDGYTHS
jgi:hypothetical protein